MKVSEKWLREWVNPAIAIRQVADQLTMAGLEVESLDEIDIDLNNIVAATIVAIKPHPDAETLHICSVDTGKKQVLQVVCGARNVRVGMKVALAKAGSTLPGNKIIEESTIRGEISSGMLCSAADLGMTEVADSLLELPAEIANGAALTEIIENKDTLLEIALTPNRGDCLSIQGIAREVSVLNLCQLISPEIKAVTAGNNKTRKIKLKAAQACPRYAGRKISDVNTGQPSPLWLQLKLQKAGVKSINPVVDATNYVMLELGQPMHAFDDDQLQGTICVRYATAGETITLLDEQEYKFDDDVLLIADDRQPLAMAGVMGGLDSAVTDKTENIFLESAWFDPQAISGIARRYGLHTDSSHRFERGVDYTLQALAIERATQLVIDICGGTAGPVSDIVFADKLPQRKPIALDCEAINCLLGIDVPVDNIRGILQSLDMEVSGQEQLVVIPPPCRFDLEIGVDLVEEVARIIGYDNIPPKAAKAELKLLRDSSQHMTTVKIRDLLVNRGYQEAITYSFVDTQLQNLLETGKGSIPLVNPIAADLSMMRTSLWPGLLTAMQYNAKRQQSRIRLFETGLVFFKEGPNIQQIPMIGALVCGNIYNKQWAIDSSSTDFYDIKRDVEEILSVAGILIQDVIFSPIQHEALHPGQSAEIIYENQLLGKLGMLHPSVQAQLDLSQPVFLFEIEISRISQQIEPKFQKISKYPMVKRDIAIVVDETLTVANVENCIRKQASNYLINLELFDVYHGEGIDSGKKSLALGLTFQGSSSTLTDEEVEIIMGNILSDLESRLGGVLRE